jgi:hypothetical protein
LTSIRGGGYIRPNMLQQTVSISAALVPGATLDVPSQSPAGVCVMETNPGTQVFELFEAGEPKTMVQFKALISR